MDETTTRPRGTIGSQHGRIWGWLTRRAINPAMRRLLTSRFHRRIGSEMITVLRFRGRKSGKLYEFPIGYQQIGTDVICYSPFGWWVNLEGGARVTLALRGHEVAGTGSVCRDRATIASGMADYLRHNPGDAFFFRVKVRNGTPDPADVERAAGENVQIRVALDPASPASSAGPG
jgi:hypothetical protein